MFFTEHAKFDESGFQTKCVCRVLVRILSVPGIPKSSGKWVDKLQIVSGRPQFLSQCLPKRCLLAPTSLAIAMNVAPVLMTKLEQGYQSPSLESPNLGMERIIRRFRSSPISPRLRPCTRSNLHQPYHSSRSLILTALSLTKGFSLPRGLFRSARATTYQTLYPLVTYTPSPQSISYPHSHSRLDNEGPLPLDFRASSMTFSCSPDIAKSIKTLFFYARNINDDKDWTHDCQDMSCEDGDLWFHKYGVPTGCPCTNVISRCNYDDILMVTI